MNLWVFICVPVFSCKHQFLPIYFKLSANPLTVLAVDALQSRAVIIMVPPPFVFPSRSEVMMYNSVFVNPGIPSGGYYDGIIFFIA